MIRPFAIAIGMALAASAASPHAALAQTTIVKPAVPAKVAPVVAQEPRDVIDAVYREAVLDLRKTDATSPFYDRDFRAKYFSKAFDLLITGAETKAAHDGAAVLDFDPISASQDAEIKQVTLKTDVIEPGKAVVSASFKNHGQSLVVSYDFVKQDGDWKIDDIKGTSEKEAWSVRKILRSAAREPKTLPGMKGAPTPPDATVKVRPPKRPDDSVLEKGK